MLRNTVEKISFQKRVICIAQPPTRSGWEINIINKYCVGYMGHRCNRLSGSQVTGSKTSGSGRSRVRSLDPVPTLILRLTGAVVSYVRMLHRCVSAAMDVIALR